MKKIIAVLFMAFFTAYGQQSFEDGRSSSYPISRKFLDYQNSQGKIIVVDYNDVGTLELENDKQLSLEAITEIESNSKDKGVKVIRFTLKKKAETGTGTVDQVAYLDQEEIASMISSINSIVSLATKWSEDTRNFTDVTYKTKDGIEIGFTHISKNQSAYIKVARSLNEYTSYKIELLSSIKQLLEKSQVMLKNR